MRQRTLAAHLELAELEQRYRQATDPVARSQWQIIWLLAQGQSTRQVVQNTGYSATWIGTIAKRYNADGPDGIGDRRHTNPGAASLLSAEQLAELDATLDAPAPDGGLWTGSKIAKWMADKLGRKVHLQRGWEVLQRLNDRSYVPRPQHTKADPAAQEQFQKTLPEAVQNLTSAHPNAEVEHWTMDEHRIGLKPIIRRGWRKRGQRPIVKVQHRYKWMYLYGFVCPSSGQTFWLLLPTVSIAAYTLALKAFARALGCGPDKQVLLVLDQAGWHISEKVVIPEGLHLLFLPPYSPELQPAEHLWELTDEAIANHHFQDLAELMDVQAERCRKLQELPELIRNCTQFHWWPEVERNSSN